jgi:hypothetical protein
MSKTFTYTKITGHYFCQHSDDWEEDGIDFDYEVKDKDLLSVIVDLMFDAYFSDDKLAMKDKEFEKSLKQKLSTLIEENDMIGMLADNYEDELKEAFYNEAMESYCN